MSDLYTDEFLSHNPGIEIVRAQICRIVVDAERFDDDQKEPAAKYGQGVIYTRDYLGRDLRPIPTEQEREHLLATYYRPHHSRLYNLCRPCSIRWREILYGDHSPRLSSRSRKPASRRTWKASSTRQANRPCSEVSYGATFMRKWWRVPSPAQRQRSRSASRPEIRRNTGA